MRAMVLEQFGDVANFRLAEVPAPEVVPGRVLVRVKATSVNPVDCKIRRLAPDFAPKLPAVLGMDVAGVVEAVGKGVSEFKPGGEVYGCAGGLKSIPGALAELMLADPDCLATKPSGLSMRQAAALPLVTITAWEGLHDKAGAKAGEHVLVHGGAGGVGHVAVQLAKAAGMRVAATVSGEDKAAVARRLGADATVNYRRTPVAEYVGKLTDGAGFDLVFDTVGGANLEASFAAARQEGRVVTTNARGSHDLSQMHARALSLHAVFMLLPLITGHGRGRYGEILRAAAGLVAEGKLTPLCDPREFSLQDAPKAHALVEAGQALGKVVVSVA